MGWNNSRIFIVIGSLACMANPTRAATTQPSIPDHKFIITDFGAKGDGQTINTKSIEKAIAACKSAGGGEIEIPAGEFVTGPISFSSNMDLHLDKGATLLLANDIDHFPASNHRYVDGITFDNCHDVAITGPGTIDGQGDPWWKKFRQYRPNPTEQDSLMRHRPYMVVFNHCQRVLVEDITLANSPSFHLVPRACEDVTIRKIYIHAPADAPNTDGIDPSGHNYLITECKFDTGDDCIAIKPTGKAFTPSCENFVITNCIFMHGHGMSVGGQTPGGLRNLIVRNCTFDSTEAGIRLKAGRGFGGLVEDLTYENLTMKNVKVPILITSYYPHIPKNPEDDPKQKVTSTTPIWRHIHITNVKSTDSPVAGQIIGLPEMPVEDVVLTNVDLSADKGMQIVHAKGLQFINSKIASKIGPNIISNDAEIQGMDSH